MIYLGRFIAGEHVFYGANFHNEEGTLADPTTVSARLRAPDGTWSDLAPPSKQDSATGFFGGVIDTSNFPAGQYIIRISGRVDIAKDVATLLCFIVGPAPVDSAAIADRVLGRNIGGGSDGGRTVKDALRILRNRAVVAGNQLIVYVEDDASVAWTAQITTNPNAEPVVGVDPA